MVKNSKNDIGLDGRCAIVTGASGSIGSQIALRLARAGAKIALVYRNNRPDELVQKIKDESGTCFAVAADFTQIDFEFALLDAVQTQLGIADILVNCAADQRLADLAKMPTADFTQMLQTNVTAAFALSREFANRIEANSSPTIINISSIEASRPALGHGAYATSKAALEMLTRALALELGADGVRVNAIAPGLIARPGIESDWPDGVTRWSAACPLSRMGDVDDVANGVLFLASDMAAFISGSVLTIDGGMGATQGW